jgi:hypothetical protein
MRLSCKPLLEKHSGRMVSSDPSIECWDIIKVDVIAVIKEIFNLRANCWNLLNLANVVLLEKKEGAQVIGDYRPISVMHNIAKILRKILANRLSPHLDQIVSHSQSAFIKG